MISVIRAGGVVPAGSISKTELATTAAAGLELGYAEITSDAVIGALADVAGLTVTVTGSSRAVMVEFWGQDVVDSVAAASIDVAIYEGATQLAKANVITAAGLFSSHVTVEKHLAAFSSTRTFKIRAESNGAGSKLQASATSPAFIRVVEC